jgi:two-component system CheB/CheR fusion protein
VVVELAMACLTQREWQIMDMIVAGQPNETIAADLGVSPRTVEHHRSAIMKKTGSNSLAALVQLARMMVEPG